MLREFPGLLQQGNGTPHPKHRVEHIIKTTGHPVFAKACRLDPDKLRTTKKEFCKLELAGIIPRSNSPWASPLHMVKKVRWLLAPCSDYRRLNNSTTPDRYPLPNMQDLSGKLAGKLAGCTHEDTAVSPSQAVFGSVLCLPGQFSQEPELDLDDFLK